MIFVFGDGTFTSKLAKIMFKRFLVLSRTYLKFKAKHF